MPPLAFRQSNPHEPVLILEPSKGDWLNNNNWGNSHRGPIPAAAGVEIGVAELRETPGPPRVYTVQLFRTIVHTDENNADVRAKVSYGVGGVRNSFQLDWVTGMQFSLLASYVKLDAVTYRPQEYNDYLASGSEQLTIAAAFGAGAIAHGPPILYTEPAFLLLAGGDRFIDVPQFARAVIVRTYKNGAIVTANNNPATTTNISLQFFAGDSTAALQAVDAQIFASAVDGIPLPGGTRQVDVVNLNTMGNDYFVSVQWVLSL